MTATRHLAFSPLLVLPMALVAQPSAPTDAALKRALVGVWCNSDDGGKTCWCYDELREDGTVSSCSLPPGASQAWRGGGRFEVKGTYSCMIVTESTDTTLRPGDRFCAQVLEVNSVFQRYRFTDKDTEFVAYRKRSDEMRCPGVGT